MTLADLLRETIDLPENDVWENERIPTPVRVFGVRLHSIGLSIRDIAAVLDLLGIDRSHGAVSHWTHDLAETQADPPTAEPSRGAVDKEQIEVNGEANGCAQPSILSLSVFLRWMCTAAAGLTLRRRSCIASPKFTSLRTLNFSLTAWLSDRLGSA
jgi:hypothetical protein